MDTITVKIPPVLRTIDHRHVLTSLVKAFSAYYKHCGPAMPEDKKANLLDTASYTCEILYDLLQNYVYDGKRRKTIDVPMNRSFDLLVEGHSTTTTILIINRAWDCYMHDKESAFFTGEEVQKLHWTMIRDLLCSFVLEFSTEWLYYRAEQHFKKKYS